MNISCQNCLQLQGVIYKWDEILSLVFVLIFVMIFIESRATAKKSFKTFSIFFKTHSHVIDNHGNLYRSAEFFFSSKWSRKKSVKIFQPNLDKLSSVTVRNVNGKVRDGKMVLKEMFWYNKATFQGSWILMSTKKLRCLISRMAQEVLISQRAVDRRDRNFFISQKVFFANSNSNSWLRTKTLCQMFRRCSHHPKIVSLLTRLFCGVHTLYAVSGNDLETSQNVRKTLSLRFNVVYKH